MLEQLRAFFALPVEEKDLIAIGRSPCHRGYVGIASETLDDANTLAGDLKETIDSGPEHGPDHPEVVAGTPLHGPNQLPDLPGFRDTWQAYFDDAVEAARRVQRGVAMALGLPADFLLDLPGETLYHFRMIHYPPQQRLPPAEGQLGCGAHTDYGSVTLLTDDGVGGLQVMRRDGTWIDIVVPDDHVVVNLGDLMAIWTNDRYVSNPHRVINPPDVDRYSMPLFVTPPFHTRIECLDTCLGQRGVAALRTDAGRAVPVVALRQHAQLSQRHARRPQPIGRRGPPLRAEPAVGIVVTSAHAGAPLVYFNSRVRIRLAATSRPTTVIASSTAMWPSVAQPNSPVFAERTRATPWYSGLSCTTQAHCP